MLFKACFCYCCIGCVNIPLREIPSTGKEAWYKLEARSQRSSVQGRIRLRLWLSAREAGRHDDDNWQQVTTSLNVSSSSNC